MSIVTLARSEGDVTAEAELIRSRINELELSADEGRAVLYQVVGYLKMSFEEFQETVIWHRAREEGL